MIHLHKINSFPTDLNCFKANNLPYRKKKNQISYNKVLFYLLNKHRITFQIETKQIIHPKTENIPNRFKPGKLKKITKHPPNTKRIPLARTMHQVQTSPNPNTQKREKISETEREVEKAESKYYDQS